MQIIVRSIIWVLLYKFYHKDFIVRILSTDSIIQTPLYILSYEFLLYKFSCADLL